MGSNCKKIYGIYAITNPVGKIYIGQSIDCNRRKREYRFMNKGRQRLLLNSILKYGWPAHYFEVIKICKESELEEYEKKFIRQFNTLNPVVGLNLRDGGKHGSLSEETKKKMKGRKHTAATRLKMSITRKGRVPFWCIGRKVSEETLNKKRGKRWKQKPEIIQKMYGNTRALGYRHTEDAKRRMAISRSGSNHWKRKAKRDKIASIINSINSFKTK